jgi:hypothetical protein
MRDLIACLHIWLTPGLRRTLHTAHRRARGWFAAPPPPVPYRVIPAPPAYSRYPLPAHVRARHEPFDELLTPFVPPYVTAPRKKPSLSK